MNGSFKELGIEGKVDFFVHCQKLLTEHHPDSQFICHSGNMKERLTHMRSFVDKYKGNAYQDENVCALYNRITVTDPHAPEQSLRSFMYHEPAAHPNAISVDFVVFKELKDCIAFVQAVYTPAIQYVLFVRHNKVKLHKTADFLGQFLKIPTQ